MRGTKGSKEERVRFITCLSRILSKPVRYDRTRSWRDRDPSFHMGLGLDPGSPCLCSHKRTTEKTLSHSLIPGIGSKRRGGLWIHLGTRVLTRRRRGPVTPKLSRDPTPWTGMYPSGVCDPYCRRFGLAVRNRSSTRPCS